MIVKLILEKLDVWDKDKIWYHGSSTIDKYETKLLPPNVTGVKQELSRKKNLDKVFFTPDLGTAKIYAGRSYNVNGGTKRIFRVYPMGDIEKLNELTYFCDWAFIEHLMDI